MGACTDTGLADREKTAGIVPGCAGAARRSAATTAILTGRRSPTIRTEGHLPKIPAEQFLENYRALMDLVRQTASRVWLSSLVPLEAHRFLDHVSQGRSRENILTWLGDTDRIFRWQEYYNDLVCKLARELSCPLLELRPEFLKHPAFPGASIHGRHSSHAEGA